MLGNRLDLLDRLQTQLSLLTLLLEGKIWFYIKDLLGIIHIS